MAIDLRDLEYYGRDIGDFIEVSDAEFKKLINDATNWLNSKKSINTKSGKKPNGLRRWTGTRFVIHNGVPKVIHKKGLNAAAQPFKQYMDKLTSASGIPKGIWKQLQSDSATLLNEIAPELGGKYPEGFEFTFQKWFKDYVVGQKTEQQFWRGLGQLYVDSGLEKDKFRQFPEVDRSHWYPKKRGGDPFTFLENWLINQSRGATEFTTRDRLQKLGIPTNWEELIDAVHEQEVNNKLTPIGKRLEDFGGYEASALMRGVEPEEIINTNQRISAIQDEALEFPERIPDLQQEYTDLVLNSRGPGNELGANGVNQLLKDLDDGVDVDPKNIRLSPIYTETDLKADTNVIRNAMNKGGGGPGPGTNISPNPLSTTLKIGGGLGIGSQILNAGSTIAKESPYSVLNPETASNIGEGLRTYQDTGEIDMANVQGAAIGFGKDLAISTAAGGGMRAAFKHAATRGATHFGGKALLGKAVPYVGWGMLAYGLYDTADAFVKGYSKDNRGITDRIKEVDYEGIINDVYSDNNSIFRRGKEQDTENLTTM